MSAASKNRVLERHWRQVELPVVDETRCTGCGWCVELHRPPEGLACGCELLPRSLASVARIA
jgi:ferredoxin